jgi:hypothetical protein
VSLGVRGAVACAVDLLAADLAHNVREIVCSGAQGGGRAEDCEGVCK